jgi:uncharacterized delta-60 repeat protein
MEKKLFTILAIVLFTSALQSQTAFLDPSFGAGGIMLPAGLTLPSKSYCNMVVQPDGKTLIRDAHAQDSSTTKAGIWIHRLLTDGSPDPDFGTGGSVYLGHTSLNWYVGNDLALLPNGKILTGFPEYYPPYDSITTQVVQLNPNGTFDAGFGTNGRVTIQETIPPIGDLPLLIDVEVQSTGRIVLIYNSPGSPYADYGFRLLQPKGAITSGFNEINWSYTDNLDEQFKKALVQPDDKILIGGYSGTQPLNYNFVIERFETNTFNDENFGDNGVVKGTISFNLDYLQDMLLEPDGKILTCERNGQYGVQISKYQANGAPDTSFGTGGNVIHPNLLESTFTSMSRSSDGRIVIAGSIPPYSATPEGAITRFLPNGALDTTFTPEGRVSLPFSAVNMYTSFMDVVVLPDHRIQACGVAYTPSKQLAVFRFLPEANATVWYRDQDGDGYGNALDSVFSFEIPMGYVDNKADCDDADASINPAATELCGNGIDEDCNGILANDIIAPEAVCVPSIKLYLDSSGVIILDPKKLDNGSTDDCGSLSFAASETVFNCDDWGIHTVTLTVSDNSGNTATCEAIVKIAEGIAPVAICHPVVIRSLDRYTGQATLAAADLDNGSYDNCGIMDIHIDPVIFNCSDIGMIPITLTVADVYGNVSTCVSMIQVVDDIPPTVICSEFFVIGLDTLGNAELQAKLLDLGSYDICSDTLHFEVDKSHFNCADLGDQIITLTVTDKHGNSNICQTTLSVVDKTPPTVFCVEKYTAELDSIGTAILYPSVLDLGSYDVCSLVNLKTNVPAFDCSDLGVHTIKFTATDVSGNSNTCLVEVTVVDKISPKAVCADSVVLVLGDAGIVKPNATVLKTASSDNCNALTFQVDPAEFTIANLGLNTVTLTASDASGNIATCTTVVNVLKPTTGVASPGADMGISLYPNPTTGLFELRMLNGRICTRVDVFNTSGQLVAQSTQAGPLHHFDLSGQAAGCYYLRAQSGEQVETMKITLVR